MPDPATGRVSPHPLLPQGEDILQLSCWKFSEPCLSGADDLLGHRQHVAVDNIFARPLRESTVLQRCAFRIPYCELHGAMGRCRIACMNVQEVEKLLTTRPFEPFGIYMSDGSAYPVTHPDQVILTPRVAHVGIGSSGNGRVVRDVVICALAHITRLGPVPKAPRKRRK